MLAAGTGISPMVQSSIMFYFFSCSIGEWWCLLRGLVSLPWSRSSDRSWRMRRRSSTMFYFFSCSIGEWWCLLRGLVSLPWSRSSDRSWRMSRRSSTMFYFFSCSIGEWWCLLRGLVSLPWSRSSDRSWRMRRRRRWSISSTAAGLTRTSCWSHSWTSGRGTGTSLLLLHSARWGTGTL